MRGLALIAPRADGERLRRRLAEGGWLRTDLRIRSDGDRIVFPLRAPPEPPLGVGEIGEQEFEPRPPEAPANYRELLGWSGEAEALLPRSFDVIGDIVLVRLPAALEARAGEIGEALLAFVPGARLVGLDRGVAGPERRRQLERLAGHGPWTTCHAENGLTLEVNLEKAYFSPRLAREHARVAEAVRAGERVFDLCCGVGPFAVTIGRDGRAAAVTAVDANPAAADLARRNAARLGVSGRVSVLEAPIEAFLARGERADRVILNLPREGIKYLAKVAPAVTIGGTLHLYAMAPAEGGDRRWEEIRAMIPPSDGLWSLLDAHVVHPYSPREDLVAFDIGRRA
jgi:tRNA (guanine37-N1)-methyltransferase